MDTFYRNHHHCHHHHHSSSPFERYGFMGTEAHRFLILLPSTSSFSFPCYNRDTTIEEKLSLRFGIRETVVPIERNNRASASPVFSPRGLSRYGAGKQRANRSGDGRNARAPTSCAMYARTSTLFAPLVPLIRNRRRGAEPLSHSS